MTLLEIIRDLDSLDEESVIYAQEPWGPGSFAMVLPIDEEADDIVVPEEGARLGIKYFLEVSITREVLEATGRFLDPPSVEERCELVIYYAANDAWPDWFHEAAERAARDRSGWKFSEPGDHAVSTTFLIRGWSNWIGRVVHDADGGWRFLQPADSTADQTIVAVTLDDIFRRDNSVGEVGDLPAGWHAWRESEYEPWQRAKTTEPQ